MTRVLAAWAGIGCADFPWTVLTDSNAPPGLAPQALVADDDPDMLDLVVSLLRREGFLVEEATNGAELLDLVREGSPANLMITDVQMPGISGIELALRMQRHHPTVPVILMSAFATDQLRERARRTGAAAVLSKPFSIAALRALVAQHARRD